MIPVGISGLSEETVMFRPTARLLSRHRISALAATVALGTSGAMLGAMPVSAATISPAHPAQKNSSGLHDLFRQAIERYVPARIPPTKSGMPGVDTGIDLAPGEVAVITATGMATCQAENPTAACSHLGPNGDGPATGASPAFLDPTPPAYSLLGERATPPLTFIRPR